ncbi:MAG: large conductance mechanosensitive channel protein MscL [Prevotella sp.]|uniref:large conductance mechanosensitive channel protein MscL n=1 Tax=Prevotella sp. TaxID=59823 RepID=UPI002A2603D7|nr:large conductance mechanosensitive channel protein MscL [Prevotella sp.]MDD7318280.1 large conductance mechanosensitive channel protein MscL [Prevotellaceae bacterium]MDY4019716.1 large conductance mechanosensitive channel protein MscL [Prevotella sp.]
MGFIKEFKEFAMKGNVMDMAVGVIIGGAFGKIVTSLVDNIIMPLVGLATGGVNFNDMFVNLSDEKVNSLAEATEKGVAVFAYGAFIQSIIDFLIIAFCIFLMIKAMNKLSKKKEEEPAAAPEPSAEEKLLSEIRDLIKNK